MEGIKSYNCPVNFTARLDVSDAGRFAERWQNIAKIFEAQTKKLPDDTITLFNDGKGSLDVAYTFGSSDISFFKLTKPKITAILHETDEKVAASFVKILDIYKKLNKKMELAKEFLGQMQKPAKLSDTEFAGKFWQLIIQKLSADAQKMAAEKPELKNFRGV